MRSENNNRGFFAKPMTYGAFGNVPSSSMLVERAQRERMNIVAIIQCLFAPWIYYCLMAALTSFWIHYTTPQLCWLLCAVGSLPLLVVGILAFRMVMGKHRGDADRSPTWFIFLCITMLISYILGMVFGNMNFWVNMQPFYDLSHLDNYEQVNPATMRGQQLMDGGRITFVDGAALDLRRAMGFKNLDTYCVAPITINDQAAGGPLPLASYDFWAVGLGCCSANTADFHCGAFADPTAKAAMRLMRDDQRPFFRLAVQQAEATYSIKSIHPLFFYWTTDATAEMNNYRDEGYKYFMIMMLVHFAFQLLCVSLAAIAFSKMGHF